MPFLLAKLIYFFAVQFFLKTGRNIGRPGTAVISLIKKVPISAAVPGTVSALELVMKFDNLFHFR